MVVAYPVWPRAPGALSYNGGARMVEEVGELELKHY
jgi:hypothetical protein